MNLHQLQCRSKTLWLPAAPNPANPLSVILPIIVNKEVMPTWIRSIKYVNGNNFLFSSQKRHTLHTAGSGFSIALHSNFCYPYERFVLSALFSLLIAICISLTFSLTLSHTLTIGLTLALVLAMPGENQPDSHNTVLIPPRHSTGFDRSFC